MISAKDFLFGSDSYRGVTKVATYKDGKLISKGEGGNRHLYVVIDDEEFHIWFDYHYGNGAFMVYYHNLDIIKVILDMNCSSCDHGEAFYFKNDSQLDSILEAIICLIR